MTITINIVEWMAYVAVMWVAFYAAEKTLDAIKMYLEWKIRKNKKK